MMSVVKNSSKNKLLTLSNAVTWPGSRLSSINQLLKVTMANPKNSGINRMAIIFFLSPTSILSIWISLYLLYLNYLTLVLFVKFNSILRLSIAFANLMAMTWWYDRKRDTMKFLNLSGKPGFSFRFRSLTMVCKTLLHFSDALPLRAPRVFAD